MIHLTIKNKCLTMNKFLSLLALALPLAMQATSPIDTLTVIDNPTQVVIM